MRSIVGAGDVGKDEALLAKTNPQQNAEVFTLETQTDPANQPADMATALKKAQAAIDAANAISKFKLIFTTNGPHDSFLSFDTGNGVFASTHDHSGITSS